MCTPLPTCSFLEDLDIMIEGGTYLYDNKFYVCTRTGVFSSGETNYESKLYCSESLMCTDKENLETEQEIDRYLCVTDRFVTLDRRVSAKFKEIGVYSDKTETMGLTDNFISTSGYYDPETHKRLGDYLRLLRSVYKLDLMPLYNCFNNYYVDNIDLSSGSLLGQGNSNYSVTIVPIKFNKTYTISMNTSTDVFIKPVIYKGKLLQYSDMNGPRKGRFIYDDIDPKVYKYGYMKYNRPIELRVDNSDSDIQSLEKYLYLAIQVPVTAQTRITVIEGTAKVYNYSSIYDAVAYSKLSSKDMNALLSSASSLLDSTGSVFSSTDNIPFSDRLVEYLIQHTIDSRDLTTENLQRVVDKFGNTNKNISVWDKQLRGQLFNQYMKLEDKYSNLNFKDILGYVDKDIEYALNRGYLKNYE